jgi:Cytochrome bd terminal oxidase subunit I
VTQLAVITTNLARLQFATTSIYHFLFVPLTLGLAPLVGGLFGAPLAILIGGSIVLALHRGFAPRASPRDSGR